MIGYARGLHISHLQPVQYFHGYFKEYIACETKRGLSVTLGAPSVWLVALLCLYFDTKIRVTLMP